MKKIKQLICPLLILLIGFQFSVNAQVTDIDGNVYTSVKIGDQVWTGENLNVSNFRNGDPIPQAKTNSEWEKAGETSSPAWCYYEFDSMNGKTLGKLYNWYAVNDERGLAPTGWHIPTDTEWTELTDNQGGKEKAAIKMKSMTLWNDYKNKREQGVFEALPAGVYMNGEFKNGGDKGTKSYWWSTTEERSSFAWYRGLIYYAEYAVRSAWSKETGISVRCIKD